MLKIACIIPARLASTRFPNKILYPVRGLPMIEHVRRRALLCKGFSEVIVATCDDEIKKVVEGFGGKVVMTSTKHLTGTDRIAEAASKMRGITHIVNVQGDEILILPEFLNTIVKEIKKNKNKIKMWNGISDLESEEDLENPSIVKCTLTKSGNILSVFRKSPCRTKSKDQVDFIKTIMGIMAFEKKFLLGFSKLKKGPWELSESIEQSRILENDIPLKSIFLDKPYPSINEPEEAELVNKVLESDPRQMEVLRKILA